VGSVEVPLRLGCMLRMEKGWKRIGGEGGEEVRIGYL
jgi:hypothetical protein